MLLCQFCGKECKNDNSLSNHQRLCPSNRNRQSTPFHSAEFQKTKNGKVGNQYTKAIRLGLQKPQVTQETRIKLSNASKSQVWSIERRAKLSESMKRAVQENPESYTGSNRGRSRQYIVDGYRLQGKWEVEFYQWAKGQGLSPKKPTTSFSYEWNGSRRYFPVFYIEKLDLYVEVKGYETDRDRAKWAQFPKRLCVIKQKEILQIRSGNFTGLI